MRLYVKDKGFEDSIVALNREAFSGIERAPDGIVRDTFQNADAVFTIHNDTTMLGAAMVTTKAGYGPEPYIWSIAVKESARGLGIGGTLLDEVALYARELPSTGTYLIVNSNNANAQRLYLKHGYRVMKFLPRYYGSDGDGVMMRRPL
jgi:ribosomal protein S18 acetylase RimI-like enzyme